MGSVTVTGTSTRSTFMRMNDPGRTFSAPGPVWAGASAPLGAPVWGAVVFDGGTTCTLLSGSSWAGAWQGNASAAARLTTNIPLILSPLPARYKPFWLPLQVPSIGTLVIFPFTQRLEAILTRSLGGWRHRLVIILSPWRRTVDYLANGLQKP